MTDRMGRIIHRLKSGWTWDRQMDEDARAEKLDFLFDDAER